MLSLYAGEIRKREPFKYLSGNQEEEGGKGHYVGLEDNHSAYITFSSLIQTGSLKPELQDFCKIYNKHVRGSFP